MSDHTGKWYSMRKRLRPEAWGTGWVEQVRLTMETKEGQERGKRRVTQRSISGKEPSVRHKC